MAPIAISPGRSIGGDTIIRVADWPRPDANWVIGTQDERGRHLVARGWHAFARDVQVGDMQIHVESDESVLIRSHSIARTLIASERLEVLAALTACVWDIAQALAGHGVGDGCVDWVVDHRRSDVLMRAFPAFRPGSGRRARRGQVHLRRDR